MTNTARRTALAGAAALAATLLTLTACTSPDSGQSVSEAEAAVRTIDNCGLTLELDAAPERVVTIKSTPLEMLLALGLEDRVIGSAFLDGPVPDGLAPAGWKPEVIADEVPGRELLLSLEPDFVFAGWTSNLSADGVGTRDDLQRLGIDSYVPPVACDFGEESAEPLDFDDVFGIYTEIGEIFEVPDRAEALIAEQRERLEAIEPLDEPFSALWYSSGEDTPFVGGGTGIPNMIMRAAGLENVADEHPEHWLSMSWEAFVESDPDVIVLVSTPWNSAEAKRERIEAHPAASTMRAVREGRFVAVDFAATEAGVRNVEAVETITAAVAALPRSAG